MSESAEELRAKLQDMESRARTACGGTDPSGGHDWIDELAGLLRVTRLQRDAAERECQRLSGKLADIRAVVISVENKMEHAPAHLVAIKTIMLDE